MENKEKNFMSAVIYVHNAERRIESFLKAVIEILEENFEKAEIICVNDSSTDNSVSIIQEISKNVHGVTISVLNMSHFHGLEMAMNAGVDLSIGDFVLEFDSTVLDFDKAEIMNIYRKSLQGYDIVSASPAKKQKMTSSLFYVIFDKFTSLSYKIYTESFRVLSRRVINRVSSMNNSIPYRKAVYATCGLKMINVKYQTVNIGERTVTDKTEKKYRKELALDTLILFTEVGYRFSMIMTIFMMAMAIGMAAYSLIIYATSSPVEGWTTTVLFMAVGFFGVFGITTIIIKYLKIIVDLVFKRKQYTFESIEKLTK